MRLIDADKIIYSWLTDAYGEEHDGITLQSIICKMPTIEPEIIRCKDCEWWEKQKDSLQGRCALMQMYPTGEWFCGNAQERRTDE